MAENLSQQIQTFCVLNNDSENSTIKSDELVVEQSINRNRYIVSDADEELLILVEFKQIIDLNCIHLYAFSDINTKAMTEIESSQPQRVHIYKLDNMNKDFNDIEAIKPDKILKCSSKKLQKGQIINLKKRSKNALKFNKIKYIAVHIKSNQNDTENTHINGILFKGKLNNSTKNTKEITLNKKDSKNMKECQIITTENDKQIDYILHKLHKIKDEPIKSLDIFKPYNIYPNSRCKLKECLSVNRLNDILKSYHIFIANRLNNSQKRKYISMDNIYPNNYSDTDLMNDYHHLIIFHSTNDQFESVYHRFISGANNGSICSLTDCIMMQRNHRDRLKSVLTELYIDTDQHNIITQQLLDRIHSYYFHTFDIGYKLTRNDRQNILSKQRKHSDNDSKINNDILDVNVVKIQNHIQKRQSEYKKMDGLERIHSNVNNKFLWKIENNDVKTRDSGDNYYSYGYRYYYWKSYKNIDETFDPAFQYEDFCQQKSNKNASLKQWYITNKFKDFKDEMISNPICGLRQTEWNNLTQKAVIHLDSNHSRTFKCVRRKTAILFDLKFNDTLNINHVIAVMIYCNYDWLQFKFSETYRKLNDNESVENMKERHRNFYFLGKTLREIVECYGMEKALFNEEEFMQISDPKDLIHQVFKVSNGKDCIQLYHGVTNHFEFESLFAFIKGPFSTTTDYSVAVSFCKYEGMILELSMGQVEWSINCRDGREAGFKLHCWDCCWLSDYTNEREIFCIGGAHKFMIKTIIKASLGTNYKRYIVGIHQMVYFMSNGDAYSSQWNVAKTKQEKQMVFRLMSHEINRYYPTHKYAHEFESCPNYIRRLLHSVCLGIRKVFFDVPYKQKILLGAAENGYPGLGDDLIGPHWDAVQKQNELDDVVKLLLKTDNGWIKLDMIMTLFPNTNGIFVSAVNKDLNFLNQQSIYNSVLLFIANNPDKRVKITIHFDPKYYVEMLVLVESYQYEFKKYSSDIEIEITQQRKHTNVLIWCNM